MPKPKIDMLNWLFVPFTYKAREENLDSIIVNGLIMTLWFVMLLSILISFFCVLRKAAIQERLRKRTLRLQKKFGHVQNITIDALDIKS